MLAALLLCGASPTAAEERACVRVEVRVGVELDAGLIVTRIGELSRRCVIDDGPHEEEVAIAMLSGGTRARVTLARSGRASLVRTVRLPQDSAERAETIAILASNMLADEAAELLALLRPNAAPGNDAPATSEAPQATEASTTEPTTETSAAETSGADASALETSDAETGTADRQAAIVEAAEDPAPSPPEVTARSAIQESTRLAPAALIETTNTAEPAPPFLRFGAGAEIGSVPQGTGSAVDVLSGLELAWTAPSILAIGLRHIGASSTSSQDITHIDLAPFAEFSFTEAFFSGYTQLGTHLQVLASTNTTFGVAPFVTVGARFHLGDVVSIALESTLRVVATDQFSTGLHLLPTLAVPWTGGLTLLFHVS